MTMPYLEFAGVASLFFRSKVTFDNFKSFQIRFTAEMNPFRMIFFQTNYSPRMFARIPPRRRIWLIIAAIFISWIISMQAGCLSMRTPDRKWPAELQKKGQFLKPEFHNIAAGSYRTIHAISLSQSDTLPLVAFVHGSPGSADAFLSYLADSVLASVVRMVSIDRPGFGYTSGFGKPEGSLERQAFALRAIVEHLAKGQKVILVGHSLGGPVIARFAMDYPQLVAGLIIVAGSIDPDLEEHPWWQAAVDVPPLCWLIPKSFWVSNREIKLLEPELRTILPRWPEVRCPVTMIHAKNDRLVPFANVAFAQRMLVNCSNYQEVILPKGDHFILWSRQDIVRQAILDMILHKQ